MRELRSGEAAILVGDDFMMRGRDGVARRYTLTQANQLTCSIALAEGCSIPRSGIHSASLIRALESGSAWPCTDA